MNSVFGFVGVGQDEILVLAVLVVLFFVGRKVMTWYWKIDRIVDLLESIDRKLGGGAPPA